MKPRMGRPPRTDHPVRLNLVLPGALWNWLVARAEKEDRSRGDVMASALTLYRKHVSRRKS